MLNLSYNVSPKIKVSIDNINRNFTNILLLRISREYEFKLAWRAKLARTHTTLSGLGFKVRRWEMAKALSDITGERNKYLTKPLMLAQNYTQAQDYINRSWYVTDKQVKPIDIKDIYKKYSKNTSNKLNNLKDISTTLDYLNQEKDHPVILAGIAKIKFKEADPFKSDAEIISNLVSQLFLYKTGFDIRNVLVIEEQFLKDAKNYNQIYKQSIEKQNLTIWLEYYSDLFDQATQKALDDLRNERKVPGVNKAFWNLNNRQKQIHSILENPSLSLTNRDVQKKFKVSQITASRDFAKLAKLGLVYRRGRGRSVYYTRV